MVCTPIFTCFKCCCCCCKSNPEPDNEVKEETKCDLFKSIVTISIMILSFLLFVGCIYWAVNIHKTGEASQPLMCTIVTMMHDVQHGYKDEKITFAGIGGLNFFLKTIKTET
jgi:hypothetical protein